MSLGEWLNNAGAEVNKVSKLPDAAQMSYIDTKDPATLESNAAFELECVVLQSLSSPVFEKFLEIFRRLEASIASKE
jgi:hypothetical protein